MRQGPPPPATSPTLTEGVRWLAPLGGFRGRPAAGAPGPRTRWRGCGGVHEFVHARTVFANAA